MMEKRPSLNLPTTQDEEGDERPLSPVARLFHEPGANIYVIAIIGMKTLINPDVFKEHIVNLVYKNRRFSSLQVLNKETGKMTWVPTHVNLDNHVIVPKLDPNMDSSSKFVEDYVSNLSKSHIDNSKPLWDLHILNTKTSEAEATCVLRSHHSIGDGMSLVNLLLACSRKASDPKSLPTLPVEKTSFRPPDRFTGIRSIFVVIWNTIVALVAFISTLLFLKDTKTPLTGYPGVADSPRRFVFTSVSFDDIKLVKNAMNVKVNEVVLGVIKAGLYRYLNRRYGAVEDKENNVPKDIRLRAALFFNMRPSTMIDVFTDTSRQYGAWGNKVAFVLLPFNIGFKKDLLDYVREVKTEMERKKASLEPICTSFITNLVIKLFGVKVAGKMSRNIYSNTTILLANTPGPQEQVTLFGHQVNYIAPSCYGQPMSLMFNVMSYVDKVTFVISADEETIPDPQILCDDLQQSLHLIKTSVLATG